MRRLIDAGCPKCGHVVFDVWVERLDAAAMPMCLCGGQMERAWMSAPSITPQGTRPERNTDRHRLNRVNTKAIAAETKLEIEQKWLRFSDETIAEEHVKREINEKAGIADAAGNELPVPKPAPITFANPAAGGAA